MVAWEIGLESVLHKWVPQYAPKRLNYTDCAIETLREARFKSQDKMGAVSGCPLLPHQFLGSIHLPGPLSAPVIAPLKPFGVAVDAQNGHDAECKHRSATNYEHQCRAYSIPAATKRAAGRKD